MDNILLKYASFEKDLNASKQRIDELFTLKSGQDANISAVSKKGKDFRAKFRPELLKLLDFPVGNTIKEIALVTASVNKLEKKLDTTTQSNNSMTGATKITSDMARKFTASDEFNDWFSLKFRAFLKDANSSGVMKGIFNPLLQNHNFKADAVSSSVKEIMDRKIDEKLAVQPSQAVTKDDIKALEIVLSAFQRQLTSLADENKVTVSSIK